MTLGPELAKETRDSFAGSSLPMSPVSLYLLVRVCQGTCKPFASGEEVCKKETLGSYEDETTKLQLSDRACLHGKAAREQKCTLLWDTVLSCMYHTDPPKHCQP
ncbi:hypothetical protein STEG23_018665 [Scotinomys teguina]